MMGYQYIILIPGIIGILPVCVWRCPGQGCRDFETFGKGDWWLFEFIRLTGGTVTRLDIAYDDFSGVLPLRTISSGYG